MKPFQSRAETMWKRDLLDGLHCRIQVVIFNRSGKLVVGRLCVVCGLCAVGMSMVGKKQRRDGSRESLYHGPALGKTVNEAGGGASGHVMVGQQKAYRSRGDVGYSTGTVQSDDVNSLICCQLFCVHSTVHPITNVPAA